jgi:hypothetical protein
MRKPTISKEVLTAIFFVATSLTATADDKGDLVPAAVSFGTKNPSAETAPNELAKGAESNDNLLDVEISDENVRDTIRIRGNFPPVDVHIRGRNRDIVSVEVDGKEHLRERLYGIARSPGATYPEDFHWRPNARGVTIGFRWGRHDDLMYAIAVVDGRTYATKKEYWKHRFGKQIGVECRTDNLIQFKANGEVENLRLVQAGSRWIWQWDAQQ